MPRTIRRTPFTVSVDNDDFNINIFNQAEFSGICTDKNDITTDPMTFSAAENVYVDENNILISRPPVKFYDGEGYILKEWTFGSYVIRYQRLLVDEDLNKVDNFSNIEKLKYVFLFRCTSHETVDGTYNGQKVYASMSWSVPVIDCGINGELKVTPVCIEDKVYFWFAGIAFFVFNMSGMTMSDGVNYPYFEDGVKYLYLPISELVINGITTDLETKNFLTSAYRKRYQYSQLSTINFNSLIGRYMEVNLNGDSTQGKSKKLYDITVQNNQDKMLLYPYSEAGNNAYFDIVQTPRATVFLRYDMVTHIVEISFDGKYFRSLPILENIIGEPILTKDGLWCVAFTSDGVAQCKLVAQESEDFEDTDTLMSWVINPYARNFLINGLPAYMTKIDNAFKPNGYFETIDNFAYVFKAPSVYQNISENLVYCYTEWLSGTNDTVWGFTDFVVSGKENADAQPVSKSVINSDDIKVHFRYVAPTADHQDLGAVVSILARNVLSVDENKVFQEPVDCGIINIFKRDERLVGRTIRNDDCIFISKEIGNIRSENNEGWLTYIHKLNASGSYIVNDENTIYNNDLVLLTPWPIYVSMTDDYIPTATYQSGMVVTYGGKVYRALRETTNNVPTNANYWETVKAKDGSDIKPYATFSYTVGGVGKSVNISWYTHFMLNPTCRYRVNLTDNMVGAIYPADRARYSSIDFPIVYTGTQLNEIFGNFPANGDNVTWNSFGNITVSNPPTADVYTGYTCILGLDNPATLADGRLVPLMKELKDADNNVVFSAASLSGPIKNCDIQAMTPIIDTDKMLYEFVMAYGLKGKDNTNAAKEVSIFLRGSWDFNVENAIVEYKKLNAIYGPSSYYRILPNTDTILTDYYLYADNTVISRPTNGELSVVIKDKERSIINNDTLVLATDTQNILYVYEGNIYKLNDDYLSLANGDVKSGDIISFRAGAQTEYDYLVPNLNITGTTVQDRCRFIIEKLGIDTERHEFVVESGYIKSSDLVRLRAVTLPENFKIPADNVGNPTNADLAVSSFVYPEAPAGWTPGQDWPSDFPSHPPLSVDVDNTIRVWQPGDNLPTGPVMFYGVVNILKQARPLSIGSDGVWYNLAGSLWTSQTSKNNIVELDEYINVDTTITEDGVLRKVPMNYAVPDYSATLNEHFLSFVSEGKNLLEMTSTRRDENKLFSEKGNDLLLYLPEANEEILPTKVTNLQNLSETALGIFTEDAVWYMSPLEMSDGSVVYSKPIKSKIPFGCRAGNDIITALDGQVLLFATSRGIAAMAPEQFVATTERSITYLSDKIQDLYRDFYNNSIQSAAFIPDDFKRFYKPTAKINTYKYWILFWRYMDRQVLALDTRNSTWWRWTLPYPIRQISVTNRLHFILQIDFNPVVDGNIIVPNPKASLAGVDFLWTDKEIDIETSTDTDFPLIEDNPIVGVDYRDDVIDGALNGISELVYDNKFVGDMRVLKYASPIIHWYFVSQKLAFGAPNNYKAIKSIILNAKGTDTITAKLSTKAFRELHHPEKSITMEVQINDLRTFIKRMNILHTTNFQYRLENDTNEDTIAQLKLNLLSIKYEIKENIR